MTRVFSVLLALMLCTSVAAAKSRGKSKAAKAKKRGQFVVAPIPTASPAIGAGLVLVGGYVFKLKESDSVSSPSVIGVVGAFTSNGSRGGGVGGRLYFDRNRYQTTFAFGKGQSTTTSSASDVCLTGNRSPCHYIRKADSSSASFFATSANRFSLVRVINIEGYRRALMARRHSAAS